MIYKKIYKHILSGFLALVVGFSPTLTYAEDYRDAGTFSGDGGIYRSDKNDYNYNSNNEGGFTAYVPYDHSYPGENIYRRMFTGLFSIYKSAYGSNYDAAGAKFNSSIPSINGISTKYFAKTVSIGGISDNLGVVTEAEPATTDLHNFSPLYNVEFRYGGIAIDKDTKRGSVITNPSFPDDILHSSGNAVRTYNRYKKNTADVLDTVSLSGNSGASVLPWQWLKSSYPGAGGVPSHYPTQSPYYGTYKDVFSLWAERTQVGAAYKAAYAQNPSNVAWDEYLKNYFYISGDYRTQSVLLTAVYTHDGHTYYTTYGIPFPVDANMIASKIQILDEKDNVLDYSERPLEFTNAINGADFINKNMGTSNKAAGQPIKLEVNKTYGVELGLTFASKDKKQSTTQKNTSAAAPTIEVIDTTPQENEVTSLNTGVASTLKNLSSMERSIMDTNTEGTINTKKSQTVSLSRSSSETVTYYYGMAGYKNLSFTVQENFPTQGILRFVVPAIYDQNGDNSYRNDDYIELEYTLDAQPEITEPLPTESYGDMNLGQRELRCLHYKKTIMEDNPDAPIYSTDPVTGEETETGEYEQMPVDYEYVTEYGTWESYDSSPNGEEAGDEASVTPYTVVIK